MNARSLSLLFAGALTVAVAGCGGGDDADSSSTAPDGDLADADLVVTAVEGIKWDKSEYSVAAGDVTVAVRNDSSLPHNLYVIAADGTELPTSFDIASRGKVDTGDVTLAAGSYTVICKIPGHGAMKATLNVS